MAATSSPQISPKAPPSAVAVGGVFNLLEQPWIPVLYNDGRYARVGIKGALEEAGCIRQVAASNPMDRAALLRFLLAVLYWCQGNPPEQAKKDQMMAGGQFPAGWFDKLIERQECFNIFGGGPRFYQGPQDDRKRPVTELLQEIPTGNNFWHFRHSTDGSDGLCAACCAMGLLRLPMFAVSGLPDLKAGINGTPPIYVIPTGRSLLHTLCVNWLACEPLGTPAWENSEPAPAAGSPVPLLDGLTRLSRRVRLHSPALDAATCIGCGRLANLVVTCGYESAGVQRNEAWNDPHCLYGKAVIAPDLTKSSFQMDKPWDSLFTEANGLDRFIPIAGTACLFAVGFATDNAKNVDVWERTWAIPPATAEDGARAVEAIRLWSNEGKKIAVRLRPCGPSQRGLAARVAATAIRPQIESRISSRAADFLSDPVGAGGRASMECRRMAIVAAGSLAPGFTTEAVRRREQAVRSPARAAGAVSRAGKRGKK